MNSRIVLNLNSIFKNSKKLNIILNNCYTTASNFESKILFSKTNNRIQLAKKHIRFNSNDTTKIPRQEKKTFVSKLISLFFKFTKT